MNMNDIIELHRNAEEPRKL